MFVAPSRLWFAALLLAASAGLRADEPGPPTSADFVVKVWETDDGLPHNSISAVLQRSDGFLWLATQGGLVRFDGLEFTGISSPLLDGVKSSGVVGVIEEDERSLLIASNQSGLVRLRDGQLTVHPLSAEFGARNRIVYLFREAENTFWIVFLDREAWRSHHGRVEKFAPPPPRRDQRMFWPASFARDAQGRVFLSRGAGLEHYSAGKLERVDRSTGLAVTVASSRKGGIWVATSGRLLKFDKGRIVTIASPAPWSGLPPPVMLEDRDGALWLADDPGLIRWEGGSMAKIATSHVRIFDLREDDEGNLWAATSGGGLNRIQRTRMAVVAEETNWTETVSGAICEDALGSMWFGNRKGVRRFSRDQVEEMGANWPKKATPLCPDAAGNIWFANGSELYRAKADAPELPSLVASRIGTTHAMFLSRDGSMWVGGNGGALRRFGPEGTVEVFRPDRGYTGRSARSIAEDRTGAIWIGTEEGQLFELTPAGFVERHAAELPGNDVRALHADAAGDLWIGTGGAGLFVRRNGSLARIAEAEGLPDTVISQILEDDHGWLWLGSRRGIFKARKNDLLECAAGRRSAITPILFGRADGLSGISAVGSYQPTAWKTRRGQLWFLTRKGLVKTDPSAHEHDRRPPRVYLDSFLVDDRAVEGAIKTAFSSARKLEFRFTAPTFLTPERVRFRYRLDGFDADWVAAGTRRFATYPQLRPGRYTFRVTASHGDLAWAREPATLAFDVLPCWWETWWARTIAVGLVLSALVALVRVWSHRRLRARLARLEQEQRVERERVRIARDLHDDLGASLTHASMMAEELSEDWEDLPDPQQRSAQLARRVRTIARDLDAVVWAVSPKNDRLSSLAAYICHFAEEYFRHSPIQCHARVMDDIPPFPLSPEARHHLFMIAKELLNNALKHSHATRVELTMQMNAGAFELVCADNGRGFSVVAAMNSGRNGLKNLHARAEEAGAALGIVSTADGTIATLRFPAPARKGDSGRTGTNTDAPAGHLDVTPPPRTEEPKLSCPSP